ncbi:MAG: hypothetical protein Q4B91_00965 [Atopobiaceae bacterium]|nr:hypothetical protein [Atopobiaceae bacterium]
MLLLLLHETKDGLDDIIALLGSNAESDISSTPLLAEAHFVSGDTEAAKGMFQRMLANGVNLILASPPFLIQLMPDDNEAAIADCGALAVQCEDVVYIRMVTNRDGSRMP